jgi:hypothetical protein
MKYPWALRHSLKNRYLMMLRNDRLADVLRDLPAIAGMEGLLLLDYLLTHPTALRGYVDLVRMLPRAAEARRAIQSRRLVPASTLRDWRRPYPLRRKVREAVLGVP